MFVFAEAPLFRGRIENCPFVKKYLVASELPSFVGGGCSCPEQGGCVPGLPNGAAKVRQLTRAEIDKLHADAARESSEEKIKIAAFVEKYTREHGGSL